MKNFNQQTKKRKSTQKEKLFTIFDNKRTTSAGKTQKLFRDKEKQIVNFKTLRKRN